MAACNRPAIEHARRMGMPGRGMMFVGDNGVQVSAFYGGSPSLPDHVFPQPGQQISRIARRLASAGEPFQRLQAARTLPAALRATGSLRRVDTSLQSRQEIHHARRVGLRLTEFALLGTATLRRYSAPPPGARPGGWGGSGRSDSAIVWVPASGDGHVHAPGSTPPAGGETGEPYYRSSKVLLWDSKAMKFTNDEQANSFVDTPYRKEWDYQV